MSAISAARSPSYHSHNGRLSPTPPARPSSTTPNAPLLYSPSRQSSTSITAPYQAPPAVHPGCVLCGLVSCAASQAMAGGGSFAPSAPSSPRDGFAPLAPIALPIPVRSATPDLQRAGPSSQPFGARPASPSPHPSASPRLVPRQPPPEIIIGNHRIIYRDDDITVYPAEGKEALCADGRHLIIVLNRHLLSVYDLGPADIPLLSKIIVTVQSLLLERAAYSSADAERGFTAKDIRIGFVNGMPADPALPYPHLHAHAFLGPFDRKLPGSTMWRRTVVFNSFNWWSAEDLRAEIREESSNCRVKSGYEHRWDSPIDKVPDAGAIAVRSHTAVSANTQGLPNALEPDAYVDSDSLSSDSPTGVVRSDSVATLKPPSGRISKKGNTSSGDYAAVRTNSHPPASGRILVGRQSSGSTTSSNRNSTSTIGSTT